MIGAQKKTLLEKVLLFPLRVAIHAILVQSLHSFLSEVKKMFFQNYLW